MMDLNDMETQHACRMYGIAYPEQVYQESSSTTKGADMEQTEVKFLVLGVLSLHGGGWDSLDILADALSNWCTRYEVQDTIEALLFQNYVQKTYAIPWGRRVVVYHITPAGQSYLSNWQQSHQEQQEE